MEPCTNTACGDRRLIAHLEREAGSVAALPGPRRRPLLCLLALEDAGEKLSLGFRKLGMAHLKGLEKLAVYEIVDGVELDPGENTRIYGEKNWRGGSRRDGSAERCSSLIHGFRED